MGSPEEAEVRSVIDGYYTAMLAGDKERSLAYFSSKRPREEWLAHYRNIVDQLGPLESYVVQGVEVNTVLKGRYYTYDVSAHYAKGEAREVVTLFNHVEEDEVAIVSHAVSADGFKALGHQ